MLLEFVSQPQIASFEPLFRKVFHFCGFYVAKIVSKGFAVEFLALSKFCRFVFSLEENG